MTDPVRSRSNVFRVLGSKYRLCIDLSFVSVRFSRVKIFTGVYTIYCTNIHTKEIVVWKEYDVGGLVDLPGHVVGAEAVLLPELVQVLDVHYLVLLQLRPNQLQV